MKTILIIAVCLFMLAGCGKGNMSISPTVEFSSESIGRSIHLIDRQIKHVELDIRHKDYAIIRISFMDKMQIGEKVHDIPWKVSMRLDQNNFFTVVR